MRKKQVKYIGVGGCLLVVAVPMNAVQAAISNVPEQYKSPHVANIDLGRAAEGVVPISRGNHKTMIRANIPQKATDVSSLRFNVSGFRLDGLADVDMVELDKLLAQWKDRVLNFSEFELVVHQVADFLREHGHPNAEVKLSRALIEGGERGKVAIAINGLTPMTPEQVAANAPRPVDPQVRVDGFKVTGTTLASEDELQALLGEYAGRDLSVKELEQAAEKVANHLRSKGYPLVQAFLPPQRVDSGTIQIAVQEGTVDPAAGHNGLSVNGGGERVKTDVVESMLAEGVSPDAPLKVESLERALLVVNDLPGIKSVRANLVPGTQPGTTQVVADVDESKLLTGSVWADNFGNTYSGENRLSAQLQLNSPTRHGEQFTLNVSGADSMTSARLGFSAPVGKRGLRLGAAYSTTDMDLKGDYSYLGLNSKTDIFSLFASYPLKRSAAANIHLSFNYDDKKLENTLANIPYKWNSRDIRVGTASISGDLMDPWGGKVTWGAGLAVGDVDLGAIQSYQELDSQTAKTAGGFSKATWSVARASKFSFNNKIGLNVNFSGQYASKNLDSVEKFQLGGPAGVRAYPVGEGLGDSGMLANVELRYALPDVRLGQPSLLAFYDFGQIRQYQNVWNNALPAGRPNTYNLQGYGVGAELIKSESGGLRILWAKKQGSNPNPTVNNTDSDGHNEGARLWIIGNIVF